MSTTSNQTIPAPFSYAPSQFWDGNDGSWSTFIVRIGSPTPQDFKVLPSTTGQETLVPVPEGCTKDDPSNCGSSRGVLPALGIQGTGFLTNSSETWNLIGIYTSDLEDTLGYAVNAQYGRDDVGLQVENSGGLNVTEAVVGGIAAKEFYLGVLGLGPKPSNFSTFTNPLPSLMHTLNGTQQIPSLAYGYTAGAAYRFSKILASLTLGGYDASRFEPTDLNIPFASDDSRPLQVAIQGITGTSDNNILSLLPTPIFAAIDSTLPYLWLPREACDKFEASFSLTYDNTTDMYIVNDTVHTNLLSTNPTITFKLGSSLYDGVYQNIEFPYAAFDLTASYPLYENKTRYFPIRRAANDTQYTLGRTFLQEAYLTVDNERQNFSIAQANFSASMPESRIVSIISPAYNLTTPNLVSSTPSSSSSTSSSSLSNGAIAGIVVGAILALFSVAALALLHFRRRRGNRNLKQHLNHAPSYSPSSSSPSATTAPNNNPQGQVQGQGQSQGQEISEVSTKHNNHELPADFQASKHELPSSPDTNPGPRRHAELEGETIKWGKMGVQELESGVQTPELETGSWVRTPELEAGTGTGTGRGAGNGNRSSGWVWEMEGSGVGELGGGEGSRGGDGGRGGDERDRDRVYELHGSEPTNNRSGHGHGHGHGHGTARTEVQEGWSDEEHL